MFFTAEPQDTLILLLNKKGRKVGKLRLHVQALWCWGVQECLAPDSVQPFLHMDHNLPSNWILLLCGAALLSSLSLGISILFRLPSLYGFALAVSAGPEVPLFSLTVVALSTLIPYTHFQTQWVIHLHLSQLLEAKFHIFMWVSRVFTIRSSSSNFAADAILGKVSHTSLSWRYGKWNFSKSMCKNWCKASTGVPFLLLTLLSFLSSLNCHGEIFIKHQNFVRMPTGCTLYGLQTFTDYWDEKWGSIPHQFSFAPIIENPVFSSYRFSPSYNCVFSFPNFFTCQLGNYSCI